jgi:hypothetical protein
MVSKTPRTRPSTVGTSSATADLLLPLFGDEDEMREPPGLRGLLLPGLHGWLCGCPSSPLKLSELLALAIRDLAPVSASTFFGRNSQMLTTPFECPKASASSPARKTTMNTSKSASFWRPIL